MTTFAWVVLLLGAVAVAMFVLGWLDDRPNAGNNNDDGGEGTPGHRAARWPNPPPRVAVPPPPHAGARARPPGPERFRAAGTAAPPRTAVAPIRPRANARAVRIDPRHRRVVSARMSGHIVAQPNAICTVCARPQNDCQGHR